MTLLVPILPLMDGVVAEPDRRKPHGMHYWSTDLKGLVAEYLGLGVEWVHLMDLDGRHAGRPVQSCSVTEISVLNEIVMSVEGGVRTWQDVRMYLEQSVDLVYLGHEDHWAPGFNGIGQAEVERRVLFEVQLDASIMHHPEGILQRLRSLHSFGVIPVLTGKVPLPDLVRVANLAGVEFRKRLILRPQGIQELETWKQGLRITGGFVQAILMEHGALDALGVDTAIEMALQA